MHYPNVDPTNAIIAVDNGRNHGRNSAIYKGATLGVANGHNFLYVTDFHTSKVETYDESFTRLILAGSLTQIYLRATRRSGSGISMAKFLSLTRFRITRRKMTSPVLATALSMCSIPVVIS